MNAEAGTKSSSSPSSSSRVLAKRDVVALLEVLSDALEAWPNPLDLFNVYASADGALSYADCSEAVLDVISAAGGGAGGAAGDASFSPQLLNKVARALDLDGDGRVSFPEFSAAKAAAACAAAEVARL